MRNYKASKNLQILAVLSLPFLAASCNRGVGCPNNFKVADVLEGFSSLLALIF